jgi:hypothetical protein
VERFIHFYDNNFWVERKQHPVSLDELNEAALEWISEISTRTIGGLNESRNERFAHEKSFLTHYRSIALTAGLPCRPGYQLRHW